MGLNVNKAYSFQGDYKKVLCVCSAGMLRSATTAWVLSREPFNYNTRAVGTKEYALIPLTTELIQWADEIICMEQSHKNSLSYVNIDKPVYVLNIPDEYDYRDPELIDIITNNCKRIFNV